MRNIDQTSAELFDKLRNRFSPIDIRDEERKKTLDPDKARFFSFNYVSDGEDLGPITISLLDRSLKIFYSTDIDAKMNPMQKRKWFKFLKDLRFFAMPEVKDFDVRDISKSGLNLHDLKYLNKDSNVFSKNEVGVNESKLYGTSRSSYQQLENVRIIARHSKPIVDETVPGARSRNIESFYIENSHGERFKLPEGTTINGARAYARHVKNGGALHDDFSKHIGRMIKEMADLRMFVRNMRGRTFEDIQTQQMVESAIDHYGQLHRDLHLIRSQRGYDQYKELWQPDLLEEDQYDLSELRERFVRKVFDERMDDALPVVFREYRRRKMAAEQEFESWAGEMVREFEEKNPTDQHNKKAAKNQHDLEEEDSTNINVKSPFANSLNTAERDSADTVVDGDENQTLAGLLNEKGFEFRFDDGIYYFESREEVERAKDWISLKFPKMKFPKMGIYDYGYGVYGSTTFDRELPGGKGVMESINEDLRKWFKEKWVRFGPDGKIRGDCARGDDSEGKPKCLPRAKAHALGKKGRKTAASRKRREDPNPERSGPAINVKTKESQQGLLEAPVQWHNTETGVKDAAQTDHTMDEALEYLKTNYPVVKMYNVRRAAMGLTALDQPKYVDTGNEADINKNIIRKSAAHMSGVDSAVDYLQLRKNNMMSGSQQVTLTIGYSWSVYENPNSGIAMLYYQDRGMAWDEIYLAGKTPKIQAQARQVFRDAGVIPTPIKKSKQQGVAEGFTDDLDNIYAMHPQPEKSEQVVFLITGMTEDEFSNRWTDLPDPYQQEFGYDLPLWDADDLSSYPNLAVKRITFDQYVRLVGNYIKSEEIGGSALSKMKRGVAESLLQEFAPGSGGGDGRWYTDDEIADIIGEDWFEFDLSGEAANISIHGEHAKILLVQEAQAYFEDRGYHGVVVQDVRDDEDFLSWYISGNFTRLDEGAAEGQITEASKDFAERHYAGKEIDNLLRNLEREKSPNVTPEIIKKMKELVAITGRGQEIPYFGSAGSMLDKLIDMYQQSQIRSGQMPQFTGRATTARDMARQIANQTRGTYRYFEPQSWTTRSGQRYRDPADYVVYPDQESYDDAVEWIANKGKKVRYRDHFGHLNTATQIGRYIVEPSTFTQDAFSDDPRTTHRISVRLAKTINQGGRQQVDITDQQASALHDIAATRDANAMATVQSIMAVLKGMEDVKRVIANSKKIHPRDKAKLDAIISAAGKQGVAEGKHSCPECGGRLVEFSQLNEKKDACYYKVKSRYKVWPSAYASGALVKCRKKGAKNWGNKSESKFAPAAKLLESFKEDLDKF